MRRKLALVLTVIAGLSLAGCSAKPGNETTAGVKTQGETTVGESAEKAQESSEKSGETKGETVKLTWWMEMSTPELNEAYEAAAAAYMEKNPNIEIEFLGIPGNSADAKAKLDMAFATDSAPDIFECAMPEFIARGNVLPLDGYYEKSELYGKVNEEAIRADANLDPKKEHLYYFPAFMDFRNFWIRPDIYAEKGVEIPETWDEFFESVKKVADPDNNLYGTTIRGGSGGAFNVMCMAYAYSGIPHAFDENGKSTMNDPLHVEFVEKYFDLYKKYTSEDDLNKGWTEIAASFTSGSTASIFHNLGSAHMISETFGGDETKFQMMPFLKSVNGEQCHPEVGVMGFGISASTEHPDEAWDFIQFLSSEGTEYWVESRGGIPTEQSAQKADWVMEKDYYQKAISIMNDENTVFFEVPTYLTNYVNIENNIAQPKLQECMAGICTAQEFLDAWADAMTEEKARYDAENGN